MVKSARRMVEEKMILLNREMALQAVMRRMTRKRMSLAYAEKPPLSNT
jgi:hypothetical protein